MKRFLLVTAAVLMLPAASAVAADMAYPVKAPAVVMPPVFSWTGFYVGVHGGYGGDKFDYPFYAYADPSFGEAESFDIDGSASLNSSGFFGGAQIGYNYQFSNNFVLGAEADIAWSGIEGELNAGGNLYVDEEFLGSASLSAGSEVEWFGTIRARAGYAWDTLLLYVTGGAAYGKVKSHGSISVTSDELPDGGFSESISTSDTQWGWTIGAGFEYAIAGTAWTLKTEYLYVDLGSQNLFSYAESGELGDFGAGLSVDTKFHTVKAGLNYKF